MFDMLRTTLSKYTFSFIIFQISLTICAGSSWQYDIIRTSNGLASNMDMLLRKQVMIQGLFLYDKMFDGYKNPLCKPKSNMNPYINKTMAS